MIRLSNSNNACRAAAIAMVLLVFFVGRPISAYAVEAGSLASADGDAFRSHTDSTAKADGSVEAIPHDGEPMSSEQERLAVGEVLERFSTMPALAWPAVRAYIWERHFAEEGVFVAYAGAQTGREADGAMTLSVMIDEAKWRQLGDAERRTLLDASRAAFHAVLADLEISGSVHFMLAGGLKR